MERIRTVVGLTVAALLCAMLAPACRTRPQPVMAPVGPPESPESLIQEYVVQGDELFQGMHLSAWRRAEQAYEKAFYLAARNEIREKLVLAKLLRLTREMDEDIASPTTDEDVRFICRGTTGGRGQALCDLARAYAAGPAALAGRINRPDLAEFDADSSPLDAYLFALFAKTFGSDPRHDELLKAIALKYRDSPLFLYLNAGANAAGLVRMTQRVPEFAEAWEFSAELSFQRSAVRPAREAFSRALELIPDYSRARNGLANIYFFTLEDYENALKTYEITLKSDRQNTAALFGKGASLHHLDQYVDSSAALDLMLATDLSRRGRVGADSVRYYRGEAYYYKAYNYHLLKDPERAREWINLAKQTLPASEEINYLSGLMFFNAGNFDAAKVDFDAALKQGRNCYAYHYLGMIELLRGEPAAASQFLSSTACLERGLRTLQENIRSVASLDVDVVEKQNLKRRMDLKLIGYRDTSAGVIQRMIGLIRESLIEVTWKQMYMDTMNDLLAKVKSIVPGQDPQAP